jgi:transposase
MERRKFTREFKLEAVRLIRNRGVSDAQASYDPGRTPVAAAGVGQEVRSPEQLEITRLKREVIKLKAERDI